MPCSDCKHWRNRHEVDPNIGLCVLLSEEHEADANDRHVVLKMSHKTRERRKKRQGKFHVTVIWPGELLKRLAIQTVVSADFFCALHDLDKRRKRLPIVQREDPPGTPPRRYQLILEDGEDSPV